MKSRIRWDRLGPVLVLVSAAGCGSSDKRSAESGSDDPLQFSVPGLVEFPAGSEKKTATIQESAQSRPEVPSPMGQPSAPPVTTRNPPRDEIPTIDPGENPVQSDPPTSRQPPESTVATQVRLSAGVALAQTLPTGTGMSFSVDYQFQSGGPQPSSRYSWVIECAGIGRGAKKPIQLRASGNLSTLAPGLKPQAGPFITYIEEYQGGKRRPISQRMTLRPTGR